MTAQGPITPGLSITHDWADDHSDFRLNNVISENSEQ
jgi:hypothetical protein